MYHSDNDSVGTVKSETLASGNFDEFGKSE